MISRNEIIGVLKKDISKAFGVDFNETTNKSRKREFVDARLVFAQVCRYHLKMKYRQIGELINKDHATIIHYLNSYDGHYKYDSVFKENVDKLVIDDYLITDDLLINHELERLELKVYNLKMRLSDTNEVEKYKAKQLINNVLNSYNILGLSNLQNNLVIMPS